jgi:hypothetical protein
MKSRFMSAYNFYNSSFISVEKDLETILKKLFVTSKPYSDTLKKLLVINNRDCLSSENNNQDYKDLVDSIELSDLVERGYILIEPRIRFDESEAVRAYLMIEFNNFTPNSTNPEYRDCVIDFTIICHTDHWALDNYQIRPIKIMGYVDGILNQTKLSGIGTLQFVSANEVVLDENLSGYLLRYAAIHGSDDISLMES